MKIVVYGPDRRVGALQDGKVIDIHGAYAKRTREMGDEPLPYAEASFMTPSSLQDFIVAGPRALEGATLALEHLADKASDDRGVKGERLVFDLEDVKIHAPLPNPGSRIGMAGGNFPDHSVGIQRRRRPDITIEQIIPEYRQNGIWGYWK